MSVITFFSAPISIGPSSGINEFDLSPYLDADAIGAIIRVRNNASSNREVWVRELGSTFDPGNCRFLTNHHRHHISSVDADKKVEIQHATQVAWELVGQVHSQGAVLFTNPPLLATSTPGTDQWVEVDLSPHVGGDTPIAAILHLTNLNSGTRGYGARKRGSTDNRIDDINGYGCDANIVIGVDASNYIEIYRDYYLQDMYLLGYLTSGVTMNTNAPELTLSTTSAWEQFAQFGTDIEGAFFEVMRAGSTNRTMGVRPSGNASYDGNTGLIPDEHLWYLCKADNDLVDGYRSNTAVTFYHIGNIDKAVAPVAVGNPVMRGANF